MTAEFFYVKMIKKRLKNSSADYGRRNQSSREENMKILLDFYFFMEKNNFSMLSGEK